MKVPYNPPLVHRIEERDAYTNELQKAYIGTKVTLRDLFAGLAAAGFCAAAGDLSRPVPPERIAKDAYAVARALLLERAKEEDGPAPRTEPTA